MSIYTKTGDTGMTSLADNQRVSKANPRLETYGTADELNAWVGMLRAALATLPSHADATPSVAAASADLDTQLLWVQNKLFNLGASLSAAPGEWILATDVAQLEQWIDLMQTLLTPVRAFILPAGSECVARCHVCRTITRRLERLMVAIDYPKMDERKFINRLSDYFFVLARRLGDLEQVNVAIWHK